MVSHLVIDPRLATLPLPSPNFSPELWDFLRTREAASALEAITAAELPAAAGLSNLLVGHFPAQVIDPQFRMAVGYGIRRVMEHVGYELAREDVQVNVPGIFSTGALYVLQGFQARDKSIRLKRAERNKWAMDRMPTVT